VSQRFPFPGKLRLKGNIVSKEIEKAKVHLDMVTRDVIVDLKKSYFELLYIDKAIEITQKIKDLAEHLAKLGATGLSMDGTTLNDVFKAQSQLAQLNYDLILLTELRVVEATNINAILNLPPESPIGKPTGIEAPTFKYKPEELYKLAEDRLEELKALDLKVEKNQEKIKLAKREYYPDFQVKLRRFENTNTNLDSGYGVFFGVKVPIWSKKNRARVVEAEKNRSAAAYEKVELKNQTFSKIKQLYFKLHNSARLIKLYKESLIPQAEKSMEIAETWYKEKKGSFSGLLEAQSIWLNFNLAGERALADYFQRLAALERLVGIHLPVKNKETL
jgi:outer membrane protein TolC